MSEFDNTPITPPSSGKPGPAGWFSVWMKAITQPNEQTFVDITEHPDMSAKTAYIWVFIAGTISGVIQAFAQAIGTATGSNVFSQIPGLEQYLPQTSGGGGSAVGALSRRTLCSSVRRLVVHCIFCSFCGDHPMDCQVIWRYGNI